MTTPLTQLEEEIEVITDEYGQLHQEGCDLNDEGGSFDGCTCDMRGLVGTIAKFITGKE